MALLQAGRWDEGIARLQRVVEEQPQFAEVWSNLGFALLQARRPEEARAALERAVAVKPELADAWNLIGLMELEASHYREGVAALDRAIAIRPQFAYAWMNRANCHIGLGETDAALQDFARALELEPKHAPIHYNLGLLHHRLTGRYDEAAAHYRRAIELAPHYANAHLHYAHALFLLGHFRDAWLHYSWRWPRAMYSAEAERRGRPYILPPPHARPKKLAIVGEMGVGDILFFLRYAPLARERGADLAFHGDARLHSMLARTGMFARLAANGDEPDADAQPIPVGDLPLLLPEAQEPPSLPEPFPLTADEAARDRILARLRAAGPQPWIALTWRSGVKGTGLLDSLFKEVPLAELGGALRGARATWISVQRDAAPGEREALERAIGAPVHDFSDVNADLEDALAAMDAVDDYIGTSNTNTHLRASTAGSARVLVPLPPEWRWMAESARSPWFPGMKVYRESVSDGWGPAMRQLAADLR